jgi:hypothetical protein
MSHDHDPEPIRGLPARLPPGERILWQGEPRWTGLARRAFHVRKVAVYFLLLLAWRFETVVGTGLSPIEVVQTMGPLTFLGVLALGVLSGLAWFSSRTTVYTITNRRLVMRIGIALTISVNVPFKVIDSAALRLYRDGTGDIPIALLGEGHVAYAPLWPHARPWKLARPQPMLRSVPDAARVAELLSKALAAAAAAQPVAPAAVPTEGLADAAVAPAADADAAAPGRGEARGEAASLDRTERRFAEDRGRQADPQAAGNVSVGAWPKALA